MAAVVRHLWQRVAVVPHPWTLTSSLCNSSNYVRNLRHAACCWLRWGLMTVVEGMSGTMPTGHVAVAGGMARQIGSGKPVTVVAGEPVAKMVGAAGVAAHLTAVEVVAGTAVAALHLVCPSLS